MSETSTNPILIRADELIAARKAASKSDEFGAFFRELAGTTAEPAPAALKGRPILSLLHSAFAGSNPTAFVMASALFNQELLELDEAVVQMGGYSNLKRRAKAIELAIQEFELARLNPKITADQATATEYHFAEARLEIARIGFETIDRGPHLAKVFRAVGKAGATAKAMGLIPPEVIADFRESMKKKAKAKIEGLSFDDLAGGSKPE